MGKIRNFFREKFTVVRARLAIVNIKSLINTHSNQITKIDRKIDDLVFKKLEHRESITIYNDMLSDLRKELDNG